LVLVLTIPHRANAIDPIVKQKYPYSVLTDDHGIITELDFASYVGVVNPAPFFPKEGFGYIYWQCFLRENVSINLEEMGYSSEDIGWNENYSSLKITAYSEPNVFHEYTMRRPWPVSAYEKKFNLWIKLMKGEKYVCFAGDFIGREDKVNHGTKQRVYSWEFDKIKTKKGCDSYFTGDCRTS
jgi:hypothetical protein